MPIPFDTLSINLAFVLVIILVYSCDADDFIKFIHGLVAVFTPHMDLASYANRVFPDYECRAMAYILCAFKLLFSLDDVTEIRQSEFAETVNK